MRVFQTALRWIKSPDRVAMRPDVICISNTRSNRNGARPARTGHTMTTLLSIDEPAKKPRPAPPGWGAFTEMGFRPLYLAGCFWALFSVLLWVHAPARLTVVLNGMLWDEHEMLWGFV